MKTELPVPWTIARLHEAYRSGSVTPTEVIRGLYDRISSAEAGHDWICIHTQEALLEAAEVCEQRLMRSEAVEAFPLLGVPFAVKDNIDVAGLPTTAACPAFAYTAKRNAAVVERLLEAGAILVGKTNLDQFATGLVGVRSPYGAVSNPFDSAYISGGSSAGSAAATAKGHVVFALGTDTAGSGRVPAGACNLVGLKPSIGLVSNEGSVAACKSLDCISIFAHLVEDAWAVLSVMADEQQGYEAPNKYIARPLGPLTGTVRVGLPDSTEFCGDGRAAEAWAASIDRMAQVGGVECGVFDFEPFREVAALLYDGPWIAERRAAIGAFMELRAQDMNESVRSIIEKADNICAAETFQGFYRRDALKRECDRVFERFHVLAVPTAPSIFRIAEVEMNPVELNTRLGHYTNFVNLLGLAAIALPGAFRTDGLPAGITLIGPAGSDQRLAAVAQRLQPVLHQRLGTSFQRPESSRLPLPPIRTDEERTELVVVGAHLSGLPLNYQLIERRAHLVCEARTAPTYRLFDLADEAPRKPGLVRVHEGGASIGVEIWSLPLWEFGGLVSQIPAPLGIGSIALADGRSVKGFICEQSMTRGARDITEFGGWRNYLNSASISTNSQVPDPA